MRYKRSSLSHEQSSEEGLVNLTPLIDVVFVVLIMFIIIAPMLEVEKVQLAKAAPHEHKEVVFVQENSPIILRVKGDNSIWINNKLCSIDMLLPALKIVKQQNPNKIPQLFHDKKAYFGTYQTVKNALELAGFETLDLILEPG